MWITESSIEGVQSEMEEALNALLKKRGCEYKVRFVCFPMETYEEDVAEYLENNSAEIIYVFLTIFLYLLKCPQSLILSALRAFCFCGKPHISRSIFLYFLYQSWLKSW